MAKFFIPHPMPTNRPNRRDAACCVSRPQRGHKNLGGGNAPDEVVTHHGGAAPA